MINSIDICGISHSFDTVDVLKGINLEIKKKVKYLAFLVQQVQEKPHFSRSSRGGSLCKMVGGKQRCLVKTQETWP